MSTDPDFARLRAEMKRLATENERMGRENSLLDRAVVVMERLRAEADAWSDEAHAMVRQRNVLLEWACKRFGFACGHDVMVAAGLAAPPTADPAVAGLVAAFGLPGETETLDGPRSGASEGDPHADSDDTPKRRPNS
jgi:hypothetical protein